MDGGNILFQEHYSLPLPPIENFAYNEQNYMAEQTLIQPQQNYAYEYHSRSQGYGYRHIPEHMYQLQGQQQYQSYMQQLETTQQQSVCNSFQGQAWNPYDVGAMLPHFVDMEHVEMTTRGRHKRSRMSLQKRLLVNARERERMRVLNKAFEALRDALPCYIADGHMAKITTLRLAINYIKALTEVLEEQKEEDAEKEKIDDDVRGEDLNGEDALLLQRENLEEGSKEEESEEAEIGKDSTLVDESSDIKVIQTYKLDN